MPMTNFERDFSRLFPESQRLERVVTLENQFADALLAELEVENGR